jgi:hypothetical protein
MVLERGNNDRVSYLASQNPNAPFDSVIKWMRLNGQITKEDPSKHKIDQPEQPKQKSNKDIEELEELLKAKSKSIFNLKQSQIESWYNEETARNTKDPKILRQILERGNLYGMAQDGRTNRRYESQSCLPPAGNRKVKSLAARNN